VGSVTKAAWPERFDPTSPTIERRGTERTAVQRPGTLRLADAPAIAIRIADLHRDGCQIDTTVTLEPWQAITIGIPGVGQHDARVMWSRDGTHGCAFERPLPSGAVTAAMSDNVHAFTGSDDMAPMIASKASPRYRAVLLLALIAAGGGVMLAATRALIG
jgi:hypothetical protein